ncbi:UNVERIFIED_CONTAM: hypothetical protein Sradi_7104800 [Sesamum radiatum]|uniref:Retrotransposon gag domain-containing protein n=1 Tax=Sesamum radiatum TaxID=300843 RepID=A0AAW2J156_SESRA
MEATNNRDSTSSGRMVTLTSEDVPLEERERASPFKNKPCFEAGTLLKKSCLGGHPHQKDVPLKKQKAGETGGNQTLQAATRTSLTSVGGGSTLPPPRAISLVADPPRRSTSSDTSTDELSSALMGAIQRIVSAAIREQLAVLTPARTIAPSNEDFPKEVAEEGTLVYVFPVAERQGPLLVASQEVPSQWLARFECLQKDLQDVQYQIAKRAPSEEQQGVPFSEEIMADDLPLNWKEPNLLDYDGTTDPQEHLSYFENIALLHRYTSRVKCRVFVNTLTRSAQQWFSQLPLGSIRSFREFRSLFLHQFSSSKRCQKTIMNLFSSQQEKENH